MWQFLFCFFSWLLLKVTRWATIASDEKNQIDLTFSIYLTKNKPRSNGEQRGSHTFISMRNRWHRLLKEIDHWYLHLHWLTSGDKRRLQQVPALDWVLQSQKHCWRTACFDWKVDRRGGKHTEKCRKWRTSQLKRPLKWNQNQRDVGENRNPPFLDGRTDSMISSRVG